MSLNTLLHVRMYNYMNNHRTIIVVDKQDI